MNEKQPSDKVFCVVTQSASFGVPRCVGKSRQQDQAYLWAANLRRQLSDTDCHNKIFVYVWRETELAAKLASHSEA